VIINTFPHSEQAALYAVATSILSFIAGAGLKGSLFLTWKHILVGLCLAVAIMVASHWIGHGFLVRLFGYRLTGTQWAWLAFFVCFLFAPMRTKLIPPQEMGKKNKLHKKKRKQF
jgi:hypothetical protein